MLDILLTVLFISLFIWTIKLIFKLTWGIAKVIAIILMIIAFPTLIGGLMVAGGLILLIPIALVIGAIGISMFNIQRAFADEYGISMTLKQAFDWTIAVLEIDSFKADFMMNMAISMAATFIGNIIAAVSFWRKAA